MKSLSRLLAPERVMYLHSPTKEEAIREMLEGLAQSTDLPSVNEVYDALLEREKLLSTGIGLGLAIPHAKIAGMKDFVVGLGLHREGLDYESLDDKPVCILTMIIGPTSRQDEYLRVLSRVHSFLKDNREKLLGMPDVGAVYELTLDY